MLSRATIYRSSTKARSTRRTSNTPVQRPNRSAPRPPSPPPSTHLHLSKCSKHVSGVDSHAGSTIHTRRAADTRFGDCAPAATKLEAVEDERKIGKKPLKRGHARRAGEPGAIPCAPATCSAQACTPSTYAAGRGHAGRWVGRGRTGLDFLRARRTFLARPCSELGAFSSKSASSYPPAGIRQAGHVSVGPPPEQPGPPRGGGPGSTRAAGMGRVHGAAPRKATADARGADPRSPATLAVPSLTPRWPRSRQVWSSLRLRLRQVWSSPKIANTVLLNPLSFLRT